MIIYFADRNFKILGSASTTLNEGFMIQDDKTVEEISPGINTFEATIGWKEGDRQQLTQMTEVGNFIIKGSNFGVRDSENTYNSLYTIVETSLDTKSQQISIYAEDAGLDLINKTVDGVTLNNYTLKGMIDFFVSEDWKIRIEDEPTGMKTYTWEGENTAIERLNSIANIWGYEIFYTFDIKGMEIKSKNINLAKKRGVEILNQSRVNLDIDRISIKKSIIDMATALQVKGGTEEGSKTNVNLKGYKYTFSDENNDIYKVDLTTGQIRNITAMEKWGSVLDNDGLIVRTYNSETTDKAKLAGEARAYLQKICHPIVNYEIDFANLPEGAKLGDKITIIDEEGELYLTARILKLESSSTEQKQTATLGEYTIKESGINEKIAEMAEQFSQIANKRQFYTWIAYADDESGSNISTEASGKKYLGIAVNQITPSVDISDPSKFKWTVIHATDGEAITITISSSDGFIFKNRKIAAHLTAHVYASGKELSLFEINGLGLLKWYNSKGELKGTGQRIEIDSNDPEEVYRVKLEGE